MSKADRDGSTRIHLSIGSSVLHNSCNATRVYEDESSARGGATRCQTGVLVLIDVQGLIGGKSMTWITSYREESSVGTATSVGVQPSVGTAG